MIINKKEEEMIIKFHRIKKVNDDNRDANGQSTNNNKPNDRHT